MPEYSSSERDGELMKRVLELEGVIRELKAQIAAETAPGHDVPQILGDQNVSQSQIAESSGKASKRVTGTDPTNEEESSELKSKRRRLNYTKCTFCREAKKKCSPDDRVWPGQKCNRCAEAGLDCSAGVTKKAGGEDRASRAKQRKSTQEDQIRHEQELDLFDWLDLWERSQNTDYLFPLSTDSTSSPPRISPEQSQNMDDIFPPSTGATSSPPRMSVEQRELKRQREQARRDSKLSARMRRAGSQGSHSGYEVASLPFTQGEFAQMPISHDPMMMLSMPPVMTNGDAPRQNNDQGHIRVVQSRPKPQCWDHGCNGRHFATFSNLLRHQREKLGQVQATKASCPDCGAEFTRMTARNGHLLHQKCKQKRQPSTSSS